MLRLFFVLGGLAFATLAHAADTTPLGVVQDAYAVEEAAWKEGASDVKLPWEPEVRAKYFAKPLIALMEHDDKVSSPDEVGALDFDPFYNAQDASISGLKLAVVAEDAAKAEVKATFKNYDQEVELHFDVVKEAAGWRIADIRSKADKPEDGWSLVQIFKDNPND